MLEDARSDILASIENCRRSMINDQQKIEKYREKLNTEPNQLRKWFYYLEIEHKANNILTRKDDLKSLALSLELTDEAIESQRRDSELIDANDHLPFSGILTKEAMQPEKQGVALLSETERITNIANTIGTILVRAAEGFFKPKKEEPGISSQAAHPSAPGSPINPASSFTSQANQAAAPAANADTKQTANGVSPSEKTPADADFDGDISCHLDRKC